MKTNLRNWKENKKQSMGSERKKTKIIILLKNTKNYIKNIDFRIELYQIILFFPKYVY